MHHLHKNEHGLHSQDEPNCAWAEHDTRGYLDIGPSCDECGACECEICGSDAEDNDIKPDAPKCPGDVKFCACPRHGDPNNYRHEPEHICVGLSYGYTCLDGGDFLCEDCVAVEDCHCKAA